MPGESRPSSRFSPFVNEVGGMKSDTDASFRFTPLVPFDLSLPVAMVRLWLGSGFWEAVGLAKKFWLGGRAGDAGGDFLLARIEGS